MTVTVVSEAPAVEVIEPEAAGAAEVQIAQIEADRDIQLAEIGSETVTELAEIQADDEDENQWLEDHFAVLATRLETMSFQLSEQLANLGNRLDLLITMMTPPVIPTLPLPEAIPEAEIPDQANVEGEEGPEVPQPRRRWL